MSDITYLDRPVVSLIDFMGDDLSVVRAARVSVQGLNEVIDTGDRKVPGLIKYLMTHRHGSPFEHATMTFYVKAPIFVFREFQRHRIASYNEMSGRYTTLPAEFYVPASDRPLINIGTSARPEFAPGGEGHYALVVDVLENLYDEAWRSYQTLLAAGIANEVARLVLPVGIYSQMYVTMNVRALMNFLSLRVDSPDAAVRSRPQREIQDVAEEIEALFRKHFPITHDTFVANGRIAP